MILKNFWIRIGLTFMKKRKNYTVLHVDHFYLLIKHSVLHVTISFVPFVLPTY